jgi:hypothetical protein
VRFPAVELGEEALLRPEEVHFVSVYRCAHSGLGKAVAAAEGEEAMLELRAGGLGGHALVTEREAEKLRLAGGSG